LQAALWASCAPGRQAQATGSPAGPLWYGYTVRTGNADVRFDDVANLAPNNGRSTRYSTAITHGNALSRVEVALGSPHASTAYYEGAAAAASPYGARGPQGLPYGATHVFPGARSPLVGIPRAQSSLDRAALLGAPGPPFRFVGQVDHSLGDERFMVRPDAQLPASHVVRRRVFRRRFRARRVFPGSETQDINASLDVRGENAQPVPVAVFPGGPGPDDGAIPAPDVVPSVGEHGGPPTPLLKAETQAAPTKPAPAKDVEEPEEYVSDADSDYAQSTPTPATLERPPKPEPNGKKQTATPLAASSATLDTSQSQDTSSVVKNHVETPLVLHAGRGPYDFRGYTQDARQLRGIAGDGVSPDWSTSKKFRHNFRVS
ncbi:unnamed protein product, partial [Ixodes hexagonus]